MFLGPSKPVVGKASAIIRKPVDDVFRFIGEEFFENYPRWSPEVKELAGWGCGTTMHVARLNAPNLKGEDHTKDIDFTPAGIRARWQAGHADTKRMLAHAPWMNPVDPTQGIVIHEPVETTVHIAEGVDGFAGRTR